MVVRSNNRNSGELSRSLASVPWVRLGQWVIMAAIGGAHLAGAAAPSSLEAPSSSRLISSRNLLFSLLSYFLRTARPGVDTRLHCAKSTPPSSAAARITQFAQSSSQRRRQKRTNLDSPPVAAALQQIAGFTSTLLSSGASLCGGLLHTIGGSTPFRSLSDRAAALLKLFETTLLPAGQHDADDASNFVPRTIPPDPILSSRHRHRHCRRIPLLR